MILKKSSFMFKLIQVPTKKGGTKNETSVQACVEGRDACCTLSALVDWIFSGRGNNISGERKYSGISESDKLSSSRDIHLSSFCLCHGRIGCGSLCPVSEEGPGDLRLSGHPLGHLSLSWRCHVTHRGAFGSSAILIQRCPGRYLDILVLGD